MKTPSRIGIATLLLLIAVSALSVRSEAGQGFYIRSGRTRCCLPKHAYGDDDARIVTAVDSELFVPLSQVTLSQGLTQRLERITTVTNANGVTRHVVEQNEAHVKNPVATAGKQFVISPVVAGPIAMTLPGAVMYDSGQFHFTCTLTHSGGRFANLSGNRCTIRVQGLRASVSSPVDPRVTQTAPVLFELTKSLRVSHSRPTTIRITDSDLKRMAQYFAEISHIRVYVECRLDR